MCILPVCQCLPYCGLLRLFASIFNAFVRVSHHSETEDRTWKSDNKYVAFPALFCVPYWKCSICLLVFFSWISLTYHSPSPSRPSLTGVWSFQRCDTEHPLSRTTDTEPGPPLSRCAEPKPKPPRTKSTCPPRSTSHRQGEWQSWRSSRTPSLLGRLRRCVCWQQHSLWGRWPLHYALHHGWGWAELSVS